MFNEIMVKDDKPFLTEKESIAASLNDDALILDMAGHTAADVTRDNMIKKANKEMEIYAETFNNHVQELQKAVDDLSMRPQDLEIMPVANYVLIKEFATNPFQRIVKQNGIITDLGGMKPVFKNTDSGEYDVEEAFILTGVVQEVGPECKWVQPGDAVMYTKPSAVPIPFYKAGLTLVNECRILVFINENITKRLKK